MLFLKEAKVTRKLLAPSAFLWTLAFFGFRGSRALADDMERVFTAGGSLGDLLLEWKAYAMIATLVAIGFYLVMARFALARSRHSDGSDAMQTNAPRAGNGEE